VIDSSPVAALVIQSPYLGDEVNFVLYTSGLLLFRRERHRFFAVRLDADEVAQTTAAIPFADFFALRRHYLVEEARDQPQNIIALWQGDGAHCVQVHGALDPEGDQPPAVYHPLAPSETVHPLAFWALFRQWARYQHPRAEGWLPDKLEGRGTMPSARTRSAGVRRCRPSITPTRSRSSTARQASPPTRCGFRRRT
jgi:hypothetical protein